MILLVLIIQFFQQVQSEDFIIKGEVLDKESKLPIAYAHIIIEGTHIGTVTNEEGLFRLHIPSKLNRSKLLVSHLGYDKFKCDISDLQVNQKIVLSPAVIKLQEVTVSAIDPFEVIRRALTKKNENYPTYPTKLSGFYRHGIKINGSYTQFIEANLDIILPHYGLIYNNSKVDREIYVNEVRAFEGKNYYEVSPYHLFDDLFFISIPETKYEANILHERCNSVEIAIEAIPKIKTSGLPGYTLYIDRKSFAFKKIEYYIPDEYWTTKEYADRSQSKVINGSKNKELRTKFLVTYTFYDRDSKWYLKQINQMNSFMLLAADGAISKVDYYIDYVTQNIDERPMALDKKKLIRKDEDIYSIKRKKNPSFWKSYPILEPSKEQIEIITEIEKSKDGDQ